MCVMPSQTCQFSVDAGLFDGPILDHADTGPTAGPDGGSASLCFGTGIVSECFTKPPTGDLLLDGPIDTDSASPCDSGFTTACVVAAQTVEVSGTVRATGSLPLVIVATATLDVAAGSTLDVSSLVDGTAGAGATGNTCPAGQPADDGGGGAGGSFGTSGGNGGGGDNPGGKPGPTSTATSLRGGCPGQGSNANTSGGAGGGAVYLIAGGTISIAGSVDASGAGGLGGSGQIIPGLGGQGLGGGAGGLVGLDAPMVVITASGQVFANGGGGGGGAGGDVGGAGGPGGDPTSATVQATGGSGGSSEDPDGGGGAGGQGAAGGHNNGNNGNPGGPDDGTGGGGGGGLGVILVYGTLDSGGVLSPSPTPP
jgi:hypothetical protein